MNKLSEMKKPLIIMIVGVAILFGGIFLYKTLIGILMKRYFAKYTNPVITVSTTVTGYNSWQPSIKAVGSARSTLGVEITAQLAGMIQNIYFKPGSTVTQGTVLLQQNADTQIAQLQAAKANAELAKITYERDQAQYRIRAISRQQLDTDRENLKSANAQVAEQTATVTKLTIRAPFTGRLGISKVNPGQYLNPGDQIVPLQSLDPIYVDFYLPQQNLPQLKVGQMVSVTADTFLNQTLTGKITTINPIVDPNNRNVEVEATLANSKYLLTPGMFVNVAVNTGVTQKFLIVPQTAVSFNPYGDIVYIVKESAKDKDGQKIYTANQVFVTTGESRGEQISILKGLKAGQVIVSSGQLKLKNGSLIKINNSVQPESRANPSVSNENGG